MLPLSKPSLQKFLAILIIYIIFTFCCNFSTLASADEDRNFSNCVELTSKDLDKKSASEQLDVFLALLDKCDDEQAFEKVLSKSPLLAKIERNVIYNSFPKMICDAYLLVDDRRLLSICLDSREKTVVRANSEIRSKKTTGDYNLKARGDGND